MNFHSVVSLLVLGLVPAVHAQKAALVPRPAGERPSSPIRITSTTQTEFPGAAFNRVACDSEGNLYARTHQPGDKAKNPIQEIASNGALLHSFSPADAVLGLSIADFFLGPNDEVHIVGWSTARANTGGRVYLSRFGRDGSRGLTTQIISEQFFPTNLAVFKSGEILLTGTQGRSDNTPFTGVFNSDGTLISKVYEPEDEDLRRKEDEGDPSTHEAGVYGNSAVEMGGTVSGSDGNVYLLRRTSPALIYVISPKGKVVRKLRIDPGDSKYLPEEIQSAVDRLAITFGAAGVGRIMKIVDFMGRDVATYALDEDLLSGTLACYRPPSLTFLVPAKDHKSSVIVKLD